MRGIKTDVRAVCTFVYAKGLSISTVRSSGMTTHVNKVHHVTTITQVAKDLAEDEDWLWEIANEMEIEDGVIWVYGVGGDRV